MNEIKVETIQRALREKNWNEVREVLRTVISQEITSAERGAFIVSMTEAILESFTQMNNAQAEMLQEVVNAVTAIEEGKKEAVEGLGKDWVDEKIKGLQEAS